MGRNLGHHGGQACAELFLMPFKMSEASKVMTNKKQFLRELPSKISNVVQTPTSNTVKKIWEDFREPYAFIGSGQNSDGQITDFFDFFYLFL